MTIRNSPKYTYFIPRSHIHGIRPRKSYGLIPASSVATRTIRFLGWASKRFWTDVSDLYRSVAIRSSPYQYVLLRTTPYLFVLTRAYTVADRSESVVRPSWFVSLRIRPCRSVTIRVSPGPFGGKSVGLRTHTVVCPYWNRSGLRNFTFP
jgi:hypothetical protein